MYPRLQTLSLAITTVLADDLAALLAQMEALPPPVTVIEETYWKQKREQLEKLKSFQPLLRT